MSLLTRNTTPAERARGCVFSELFRDGESVARNGGSPTGSPAIDQGVTLDGSTQYLTYDLDSGGFDSSGALAFVFEFSPNFAANDGVRHIVFDCSSTILSFSKRETNDLWVTAGGAPTINVALANYQAFWLVGQKNILVYSGVSGANNCWLNGNLIATTATTYLTYTADDMTVGASVSGTFLAACTAHSLKIFTSLLTAQEAADFYTGDAYGYRNETSLNLPMRSADHDPTNLRTLDVSGNDRHATFGDGSTPTTYPTKLGDRHGYEFDGADYMTVTGTGVFNAAGVTIAIEFWPEFKASDDVAEYLCDSTSPNRYFIIKYNNATSNILQVFLGQTVISNISLATYSPYWFKGRKNILVVSGTSGNTSAWLNGVQILANDTTAWTAKDPANIVIGAAWDYGRFFNGQINSFRVWQRALTPLQIADLTIRAGIQVNDI